MPHGVSLQRGTTLVRLLDHSVKVSLFMDVASLLLHFNFPVLVGLAKNK